jgi:hypothetical protein
VVEPGVQLAGFHLVLVRMPRDNEARSGIELDTAGASLHLHPVGEDVLATTHGDVRLV